MKRLFVGSDGEIRPWLQLICIYGAMTLAQFIIVLGITFVIGFIVGGYVVFHGNEAMLDVILAAVIESVPFNTVVTVINNVVGMLVLVLIYYAISKKSVVALGFTHMKKGWKDLVVGLFIGIILISILVGSLVLIGGYQFTGVYFTVELLLGAILFIFVGFYEELLVRGLFQHVIYKKHSILWAILIPSILFSIMHFANPNIGGIAALNLFLAGVLFGVMTYKTGNIWMAIGVHITWNYTMGNVFGIEVSGMTFGKGLIQMERTQDTLLNGGNFGLEGGYLCTILLCIAIVGFTFAYKKRSVIEEHRIPAIDS